MKAFSPSIHALVLGCVMLGVTGFLNILVGLPFLLEMDQMALAIAFLALIRTCEDRP